MINKIKNKALALLTVLLASPLVSAAEEICDGAIGVDMFCLLVEGVFGSLWLTGVAFCVFVYVIGITSRMSPVMIIFIITTFLIGFVMGAVGPIAAFIGLILGLIYFIQALWRYFRTI